MQFSYKFLQTQEEVLDLITYHNMYSASVAIDTETTDKDPRKATLLKVIITGRSPTEACMFDATLASLLSCLKPNLKLVFQNFKYDYHVLIRHGIDLRNRPMSDTMLLHHLIDENAEHSLDSFVKAVWADPYKEKFWERNDHFETAPLEEQLEYACKDVIYTGLLEKDFLKQLDTLCVPQSLITEVHDLALALFETELLGVRVDIPYLMDRGIFLQEKILQTKTQFFDQIGMKKDIVEYELWVKELLKRKTVKGKANVPKPEFSIDSQKQIMTLFYDLYKLPVQVNEKTKNPSVDDKALEALEDKLPAVKTLRDYRGHQKVYTAYIEGTLERKVDDRIYPSFNINGTHTGRISASNPNLQQLPREGGIRGIYIPDPGHKFIACDYSQLEVVIAAHYSRDPSLLKIVLEGANQHDLTAAGLGIPRATAKTINFALQYGAGVRKVQAILNCSEKEAKIAFAKYWETYPGVKALMDACASAVDRGEPVTNIFGRRRNFPETFPEPWMKAKAKRQAFNFLIQSTGADITHLAYYRIWKAMKQHNWGRAMWEIHDEILVMPKEEHVKETQLTLQSVMINIGVEAGLTVPLKVDCSEPKERWEK